MSLTRCLPLILSDIASETDDHFVCLSLLNQIINILLKDNIIGEDIIALRTIIESYIFTFTQTYPAENIIPKMHHLLHYPALIGNFGPLKHVWTNCFENEHFILKTLVRQNRNFKNIPLTMAKKKAIQMCSIKKKDLLNIDIAEYKNYSIPVNLIGLIPENSIKIDPCVINSLTYSPGQFILSRINEEQHYFLRINAVFKTPDSTILFYGSEYTSLYENILNCYEILDLKHENIIKKYVELDNKDLYYPLNLDSKTIVLAKSYY